MAEITKNHENHEKSMKIIDFFEISIWDRLECSNRCGMVPGRSWEYCEAVGQSAQCFESSSHHTTLISVSGGLLGPPEVG